MNFVFVDTGGWIAMMVKRDRLYNKAISHYRKLSETGYPLITSNYILVETYTRIRYDDGHLKAVQFHKVISEAVEVGRLHVEWITQELNEEAWSIFKDYKDQEFSFVDCTSFVVAKKYKVAEVFGFDQGFATMGFILRPDGG
ncbi:MAG: hypothetical protein A2035_01895 [Nitrospirae bacterium GWA2_42_11]|nr:MAG: hypothetical protein A2035_01895 [Nitrospirae bacterium GWA2_42_11]